MLDAEARVGRGRMLRSRTLAGGLALAASIVLVAQGGLFAKVLEQTKTDDDDEKKSG